MVIGIAKTPKGWTFTYDKAERRHRVTVKASSEWMARLKAIDRLREIGEPEALDELAKDTRRMELCELRSLVYFVQRRDGLVKIGYTTKSLESRIRALETGAGSLKLLGVCIGGRLLERGLHRQFSNARVEGEWFLPCEKVLGYINAEAMPAEGVRRKHVGQNATDKSGAV